MQSLKFPLLTSTCRPNSTCLTLHHPPLLGGEAGVQVVREWSRVVMVMETVIVLVRRGLSRVVMVRRLRLRMRTIVMIRIDIEYPSMVDADT